MLRWCVTLLLIACGCAAGRPVGAGTPEPRAVPPPELPVVDVALIEEVHTREQWVDLLVSTDPWPGEGSWLERITRTGDPRFLR